MTEGASQPVLGGLPESSERRPPVSLVATIVAWTRLTVIASGLAAAALVGLLVVVRGVYEPRVEQAVESTAAVRSIHEAMLDQEAGLRGFLLSRDDRFLEAYERGHDALPGLNAAASRLLAGQGEAGRLLLDMRLAQQSWTADWAVEALRRGQDPAGPIPDAFLQKDKALFDAYRERDEALVTHLVARRHDALRAQSNALLAVVGLAIAATGLFLVYAGRRGRALRQAVGPPIRELLERLERIQAGDFSSQPALRGVAELEVLGVGVADTSDALAHARARTEEQTAQLAARGRQQSEVLRLAREVAGSLNLRYVLRGVCTAAAAITEGARVVVWLRDDQGQAVEAFADSAGPDLKPIGLEPVPLGEGLVGRAARFGRVQGREDGLGSVGDSTGVALPMVVGAQVIGVLELTGPGVRSLAEETVDVLETLAIHAATAIEAARLHEHTETMAMTDVLTGLPNRRRLDGDLEVEVSSSVRYSRPLAFLMVDVDHFKSYNDTFGHQAGDVALQELAGLLAGSLRGSDTIYRYGGEEFALVLRETTREDAAHLGERLRHAVEHHFSGPAQPRPVTISVGIAGLPEHGPTAETLVAAADAALYEAKGAGRNCLISADPPAGSEAPRGPIRLRPATDIG